MSVPFRMTLAIALLSAIVANSVQGEILTLRDGKHLIGRVESSGPNKVSFAYQSNGVAVTANFTKEQLDPHSWYNIRGRAVGNDAEARLRLVRFTVASGMFAVAERELDRILSLDPTLAETVDLERAQVRDGSAAALLKLSRELLSEGRIERAWELAGTALTRFRGSAHQDEIRAFLDVLEKAQVAALQRKRTQLQAEEERAALERREQILGPASMLLEQARRRNIEGLKQDDLGSSLNSFVGAARAHRSVLRKADEIEKKHGNDLEIVAMLADLRGRAIKGMVDAHMNMGSLYVVRGSFVEALRHANEAIAADGTSSAARSFRARVEIASAEAARSRYHR